MSEGRGEGGRGPLARAGEGLPISHQDSLSEEKEHQYFEHLLGGRYWVVGTSGVIGSSRPRAWRKCMPLPEEP